jgi:hypothetical protein
MFTKRVGNHLGGLLVGGREVNLVTKVKKKKGQAPFCYSLEP